jgi:asparagine synthase (glutamine-hydrolysing)
MCGILGIVSDQMMVSRAGYSDSLSEYSQRLSQGLCAIARRGPDGHGMWHQGRVMLGHVRLAIIDPNARSDQPMESENWVLCYNGEVYNFRDIRIELTALGHSFKTVSDTEVILRSLEQWGIEGCISRIAGMFAFLAVNKKNGVVYAVRDHMGIKPLLYSIDKKGAYYFGSSVTAIKAMRSDEDLEIDRGAIGSYMALGGVHGTHSVYKEIKKIPSAHYMEITPDGKSRVLKYWEPKYQTDFRLEDLISIVQEYQVSDVKSALFLSGGVDSSFLASVYGDFEYFHLTSPEEVYAQMVADRFRGNLIKVRPELSNYESDVEAAIAFHGEPMMSVGIPLAVSRELKANGYKMAISANGADELFLGYSRTPHPEYTPPYLPLHEAPSKRFLLQQLQHIFREGRNFSMADLDGLIPSIETLMHECLTQYHLDGFPTSASYRWTELMTYVLSDLNPTLDAASMFNSVEVRVPFLDHRIVQGVLSWDAAQLITPELGRKAPLKQHLAQYFPQTLYQRTKLGFSIHSDKLSEIAKLSENALGDSVDKKRISFTKSAFRGEYERDLIYLGSSLLGLAKWEKSMSDSSILPRATL